MLETHGPRSNWKPLATGGEQKYGRLSYICQPTNRTCTSGCWPFNNTRARNARYGSHSGEVWLRSFSSIAALVAAVASLVK
jgi:hypothetical protein